MKPENLATKIFLDSGSPAETKAAIELLGFLDGQTTNPSYFAKSEEVKDRIEKEQFTEEQLWEFYKGTIKKIRRLLPQGSISIEVYADAQTKAEAMVRQAKEMSGWIPDCHVKLPITKEGLKAARQLVREGVNINMTVCFTQEQAAAVYSATRGAKRGSVFVSPFMGRWFDDGVNGLDLVKNIIRMYSEGDGHVQVLAASLRNLQQFYAVINLKADIITAGLKFLQEWKEDGLKLVGQDFVYESNDKPISYQEIDLSRPFDSYNIDHPKTTSALAQFVNDWNGLLNTSQL